MTTALKTRPKPSAKTKTPAAAERRKPAVKAVAVKAAPVTVLRKTNPSLPAWIVTGPATIAVRAGTEIRRGGRLVVAFPKRKAIRLDDGLIAGTDYVIVLDGGVPTALAAREAAFHDPGALGGFHYAPGGNADPAVRKGGDVVPAINPLSLWDLGFRPSCPDPRGMAYVAGVPGSEALPPFWCDIYLLAQDHEGGTSRFGRTIADGNAVPTGQKSCDYAAVGKVYAKHGKQLLSVAEFAAAAFGVTERKAAGTDPVTTGLDAARSSACGLMQAAGNLRVWGHDGDPDPALRRPAFLGGNWNDGDWAGSRYAYVPHCPDDSYSWLSARGRSDHLQPASPAR